MENECFYEGNAVIYYEIRCHFQPPRGLALRDRLETYCLEHNILSVTESVDMYGDGSDYDIYWSCQVEMRDVYAVESDFQRIYREVTGVSNG